MTSNVKLPSDGSFVKVTDGTNSAWITGTGHVYIGTDDPDANSVTQPIPFDGMVARAPAIVWVRSRGSKKELTLQVATW